jgi:hypothetical protein
MTTEDRAGTLLEAVSFKPLTTRPTIDLRDLATEEKDWGTVLVETTIGALATKLLYDYSRGIGPEHPDRLLLAAEKSGADGETILRMVQLDEAGMILVNPDLIADLLPPK